MVIFVMSAFLSAGEKEDDFYGYFTLGYRFVSTDGVETRYKEDINLDSGPRLFNLNLHYKATGSAKKIIDRLDLDIYNFGGDPYETMGLSIVKYGKFKFDYKRRKSTYFYQDIQDSGDMHHFDFERIMDSGAFKIRLCSAAKFYLNFDLYTKKGSSTQSFDISRDEFEFDKPIDEMSKTVAVGLDVKVKKFAFVLEEKIQDYENTNSMFLPGFSLGEDPDPAASLNYFFLNQPYDFKSYTTTAKIKANPFAFLLIQGAAQISKQDTNLNYTDSASGASYLGDDFAYMYQGSGSFERNIKLYDLDLTLLLSNKLAVVGAVRYKSFVQDGELTGDAAAASRWKFDTLGLEGGLQFQASSNFALTFGLRSEERDIERGMEEAAGEEGVEGETTKRRGFFGNMLWKLSKNFKLTADYQYGTYQDVFTLTSPTQFKPFPLNRAFESQRVLCHRHLSLKQERKRHLRRNVGSQ